MCYLCRCTERCVLPVQVYREVCVTCAGVQRGVCYLCRCREVCVDVLPVQVGSAGGCCPTRCSVGDAGCGNTLGWTSPCYRRNPAALAAARPALRKHGDVTTTSQRRLQSVST